MERRIGDSSGNCEGKIQLANDREVDYVMYTSSKFCKHVRGRACMLYEIAQARYIADCKTLDCELHKLVFFMSEYVYAAFDAPKKYDGTQILELARTAKPSVQQLRDILRDHLAVRRYVEGGDPTHADIRFIFAANPSTMFLTISHRACAHVSQVATEVLFGDVEPVAWLPADPESNRDNSDGSRLVRCEPMMVPVHIGARLVLTKNLNKSIGFVNGIGAED